MSERRYSESEVAQIFERATETQHQGNRVPLAAGDGMTLGALQDIGREVGIAPELIARAALTIDRIGEPATRRLLGLPIGVARTVSLPRKLTDAEWDRLVVDLRETFDARGTIRNEGAFRQWTNGNLQALLEPTETGHRLRLRTRNAISQGWIGGGLFMLGFGAIFTAAAFIGDPASATQRLPSLLSLLFIGAGMFTVGGLRLLPWSRRRREQMEAIAARTSAIASESPRA